MSETDQRSAPPLGRKLPAGKMGISRIASMYELTIPAVKKRLQAGGLMTPDGRPSATAIASGAVEIVELEGKWDPGVLKPTPFWDPDAVAALLQESPEAADPKSGKSRGRHYFKSRAHLQEKLEGELWKLDDIVPRKSRPPAFVADMTALEFGDCVGDLGPFFVLNIKTIDALDRDWTVLRQFLQTARSLTKRRLNEIAAIEEMVETAYAWMKRQLPGGRARNLIRTGRVP